MNPERGTRVIIALTETAPIDLLWTVTLERLASPETELLTLYIADDRWQRAASLPFTQEIPRLGGIPVGFTQQRAQDIHDAAIARARERMQQLAAEAKRRLIFEILSETDERRVSELVREEDSILIAPSLITKQPIFAQLSKTGCRIELVEVPGPLDSSSSPGT
jgi:hypothetical protein